MRQFSVPYNGEEPSVYLKQLEEFKRRFKHILVVYDNDRPGLYNMAKIRRQYPNLNYFYMLQLHFLICIHQGLLHLSASLHGIFRLPS